MGRHKDLGELNAWRAGRQRAVDEIETKRGAPERARTEGTDITRAVAKTKDATDATDAAWPNTNTQEQK